MQTRNIIRIIVISAIVLLTLLTGQGESKKNSAIPQEATSSADIAWEATVSAVRVKRVVDGDTIELVDGRRVRYIGVDTPEMGSTQKTIACFAKEAMRANSALVEGKEVRLEKDISETDKFGRLLRYVYVGDVFVNEKLAREGYAQAATFPPDVKYKDLFLVAQREAREQNRGLWEKCK